VVIYTFGGDFNSLFFASNVQVALIMGAPFGIRPEAPGPKFEYRMKQSQMIKVQNALLVW
jgi:hypothetical protein